MGLKEDVTGLRGHVTQSQQLWPLVSWFIISFEGLLGQGLGLPW